MHWEPGIFVPTRGWIHVFDWDPPPVCEIEEGPLFIEIRRSGPFPKVPEVNVSITYRIFTNRTYVESSTGIEVVEPVGVVSLRNLNLAQPRSSLHPISIARENPHAVPGIEQSLNEPAPHVSRRTRHQHGLSLD